MHTSECGAQMFNCSNDVNPAVSGNMSAMLL